MKKLDLYITSKFFGLLADDYEGSKVYGFENRSPKNSKQVSTVINIPLEGGCFIVIQKGAIRSKFGNSYVDLYENYWQSTSNGASFVISQNTVVALFQKNNYHGMEAIGIIEKEGRLNYIDGCKDSLLFQPIKKGLPCLNSLFMPNGVNQTMHKHPSTRSGIILFGNASCETDKNKYDLEPGMIFFMPKNYNHKFRTDFENGNLKLAAYHPDSDQGPTDDNHIMLNRTIVDGISAKDIEAIKTKNV